MRRLLMAAGAVALLGFFGCSGEESDAGLGQTAGTGGQAGGAGEAGAAGQAGQGGEAGTGVGGQAGAGPTAEQACDQLASVYCNRLEECTPTLMDILYGDKTTCFERMSEPCAAVLALPDTTKTPSWTSQCSALLNASSCEEVLTRLPPTECTPAPGARKAGATCADDGQCETSYCKFTVGLGCGLCAPKAAAGEGCDKDDDCVRGTGCAPDKKCAAYGVLDGPCDLNHPCAGGLSCVGATSQAQGVCKVAGVGGQQCDSKEETKPGCNVLKGFFCNPYANLCQELKLAKGGEGCGVVGTSYAVCTSSAMCKLTSSYSGTCLASAADGESCDNVDGPYCMPLSQCIAGKCIAPAPAACQ